jgi:hypothetical protein
MPVGGMIHRPGSMGGQLTGNGLFAGLMGMAGATHADLSRPARRHQRSPQPVMWQGESKDRPVTPKGNGPISCSVCCC